MSKFAKALLLSTALTALPAIAADPAREPRGTGSPQAAQSDEARRQQCQKYQGAQRDECMQGKHFGGQVGQHPSLPGGGASGRQEVPGTGTTVPRRTQLLARGADHEEEQIFAFPKPATAKERADPRGRGSTEDVEYAG